MRMNIAQMLFLTFVASVLVVVTRPLWMEWDWHRFFCGFLVTMHFIGLAPTKPDIADWVGLAGAVGAYFGMLVTSVVCLLSLYGGVQFYSYLGSKKDA